MKIGMLWYDNEQHKPIVEKIRSAINYYYNKYGTQPDSCYIHSSYGNTNVFNIPEEVDGIKVKYSNTVLPHHFWVGVENAPAIKDLNFNETTEA